MPLTLVAQAPTIKTSVHLVQIPAIVKDAKGKPIDGIKPEEFQLLDDAIPQTFQADTADTVQAPVAIVVAIQSSGIALPALAKIQDQGGIIQPLIAGDRGQGAVLAYDSEVRTIQDFTTDGAKIRRAFFDTGSRSIKTARMVDAVKEGVRMLETRPEAYRRVLLIIGEARDRGSKSKLDPVIELAQRANVSIYTITYSVQAVAFTSRPEDVPPSPGGMDLIAAMQEAGRFQMRNAADALSGSTGGSHQSFTTVSALEKAFTVLSSEIHSQYLLSFAPVATKNTGFHRIQVLVPSRPNAIIRARPGYWPESGITSN